MFFILGTHLKVRFLSYVHFPERKIQTCGLKVSILQLNNSIIFAPIGNYLSKGIVLPFCCLLKQLCTYSRHFKNPVSLCSNNFNMEGICSTQIMPFISLLPYLLSLSHFLNYKDVEKLGVNKMLVGKIQFN